MELLFASPGGDGLKVMFRLAERCCDAALYKVFYRLFAAQLSAAYGLEQVIDGSTCDVTRACFISVDPEAYFNPEATPVDLKAYINPDGDPQRALELKNQVGAAAKAKAAASPEPKAPADPAPDVLERIRRTLNPAAKLTRQKAPAYVPQVLEDLMPALREHMLGQGIDLTEVISISYGKKLRFRLALKQAEVNVFYGKRGFSVVQSARTGTDPEANQLMAQVVEAFLVEMGA